MISRDCLKPFAGAHALIVENDILIAAFIEGVLLDHGITAENVTLEECQEYSLRRRYDVAIVGIDRITAEVPTVLRLLERRGIAPVFFSALRDPYNVAAVFPQIRICHYDCQDNERIALEVLRAIKSSAEGTAPNSKRSRSFLQ